MLALPRVAGIVPRVVAVEGPEVRYSAELKGVPGEWRLYAVER
jgi:hypothetical protein